MTKTIRSARTASGARAKRLGSLGLSAAVALFPLLAGCQNATNGSDATTASSAATSTDGSSSSASSDDGSEVTATGGAGLSSVSIAGGTCVPVTLTSDDTGDSNTTGGTGAASSAAASVPTDMGIPPAMPSGDAGSAPADMGTPPDGTPPSGDMGTPPDGDMGTPPGGGAAPSDGSTGSTDSAGSGGDAGGASSSDYTITGATTITTAGGTSTDQSDDATDSDQSAILVSGEGTLEATNPTVTKSGDTSSNDASSFYGLNAAVLATDGGAVYIDGGDLTSTSTGSNVLFAYGSGSVVCTSGGSLHATAQGGHAFMVAGGGTAILENVDMTTSGANGAPIASDRGSGTVAVTGGTITSKGADSPIIYSTGDFTVTGITGTSEISEGAVIEGMNSISLIDSTIEAASEGVMIYQSMSGDAAVGEATYLMSGGTITTDGSATGHFSGRSGDGIYVGQTDAEITLKDGAVIMPSNGVLVYVTLTSQVILHLQGETLEGDLIVDGDDSSLTADLTDGTTLTGGASGVALTIDESSMWNVTKDSTLTTLAGAVISGDTITNITGNGHTVTYDASADGNSALNGKTYQLTGGGTLTPAS